MDDSFYVGLEDVDPEVHAAIELEHGRQEGINLIASESLTSLAVRQASSSVLTNKYAEGYPHKRYYGGCEYVDIIEDLAISRCRELFGAEHVNVQPHSGTQANMAVYLAALEAGDTILSLELSHGGHLSHGYKVNFSGKIYRGEFYTVSRQTGMLDMAEVEARAREVKPKIIVCGYSAYPRVVPFKEFSEIAEDVGAFLLADIAHIAGLIGSKVHPSPVKYADFITSTTHKTLMGPRGAIVMCRQEHAKKLDSAVFPGMQGGPFMQTIAAKAVCFKENLTRQRQKMNAQIVENAKFMADDLVADGFDLVSGGTDNHLMLIDLSNKGLNGKDAEANLGLAGITVNKNTVPFDTLSPFVTSGIRVGTPSVTSRGMGEKQMRQISGWLKRVIVEPSTAADVKKEVDVLCSEHPVYTI